MVLGDFGSGLGVFVESYSPQSAIFDPRPSILDLRLVYLDGDRFYSIHVRRLHAQNTEQANLSGQRGAGLAGGRRDCHYEGALREELQMGAARYFAAYSVAQRSLPLDEKAPTISGARSTYGAAPFTSQERGRSNICKMLSSAFGPAARGGRAQTHPE